VPDARSANAEAWLGYSSPTGRGVRLWGARTRMRRTSHYS